MADLLDIDAQIENSIRSLRAKVEALTTIVDANEKKAAIAAAKKERTEVVRFISSLRAAIRGTTDKRDKTIYEKKRTEYDEEVKDLLERINQAAAPPAGAGGRRRRGGEAEPPTEVNGNELQSTQQVFTEINTVQDKTLEMARRTERIALNTEQISLQTLQTLQKQNEIIIAADDTLDGLDSNLKRASRQVQAIARKMAGDKFMMCLFCILVLALAFLIFWKIYDGRMNADKTEATSAPVVTEPPEVTLLALARRVR